MRLLKREETIKKTGFLIGRLIFGGFFLYNGINHLINKDQLVP